jgi:hypothetical protein
MPPWLLATAPGRTPEGPPPRHERGAVRYFFGVLRGLLPAACRVLFFAVLVFAVLGFAVLVFAVLGFAVLVFAVLGFAVRLLAALALLVLVLGLAGVLTCAATGCSAGAAGSAVAVVVAAASARPAA